MRLSCALKELYDIHSCLTSHVDIDGDGRADYCLIAEQGNIRCSRNGGQGDSYYWQGFTTQNQLRDIVFTGKNKGNADGVRFVESLSLVAERIFLSKD